MKVNKKLPLMRRSSIKRRRPQWRLIKLVPSKKLIKNKV